MRALRNHLLRAVVGLVAGQLLFSTLALPGVAVPAFLAGNTTALAEPLSSRADLMTADASTRSGVIALVNQERAAHSLAPLTENPDLDASAQSYAQVLTQDNCFGHACGSEPDFTTRDTQAGYTSWAWLGENLAAGQPTPEAVVSAWMASPDHRENILRAEFTEVGVGVAYGGTHRTYWAEEFGARPTVGEDAAAD